MSDSSSSLQYENEKPQPLKDNEGSSSASSGQFAQKSFEEMRSSPRTKFEYPQQVAPMLSKLMPMPDDYVEVECNDISRGGISFFLKRQPGCKHFAITLGKKPNLKTMLARVCYTKPVTHEGQQMFLIGCKFVDRIHD